MVVFLKRNLIFIFLLLICICVNLINIEERIAFDWDQARDAQVAWSILKEHKLTLIGPRVLGPDAFFLGPLWFYLLLPFYWIFSLNPIALGFFAIASYIFTSVLFYKVGKLFFDKNTALISVFLYLPLGAIVVWNPSLIPAFVLLLLYSFAKVSQGEKRFIPISFFILGLSLQIHLQFLFFVIPFLLVLAFYCQKNKLLPKDIILGLCLFLLTFMPIFIFDLRHDFLNLKGVLKIFFSNKPQQQFFSHYFFNFSKYLNSFSSIAALLFATLGLLIVKEKYVKYLLIVNLFLPPVIFSFYGGNLSEYYFTLCAPALIFGQSLFLQRFLNKGFLKGIFYTILILLAVDKFRVFESSNLSTGLANQRKAVEYIVNQKLDPVFNVSYSTPANLDVGFKYLFKLYKKMPQNIPEGHLWTIVIPPTRENIKPLATFGEIGVTRR